MLPLFCPLIPTETPLAVSNIDTYIRQLLSHLQSVIAKKRIVATVGLQAVNDSVVNASRKVV